MGRFQVGKAWLRKASNAAVDGLRRLLPQRCELGGSASGDALVCAACNASMPCVVSPCPVCALPAPPHAICGECRARPPPFSATRAAWEYAFPADRLVHALKYGGQLALASPLADALLTAVRRDARLLPDAVLALPLAPARQRERGFNQAAEIARRVAAALDRPLTTGLARARDSPPQAALPLAARAGNVRGAFVAQACLASIRVAIVDDVMTPGATRAAAARAARRAGALDVEAWVVTRTLPPSG